MTSRVESTMPFPPGFEERQRRKHRMTDDLEPPHRSTKRVRIDQLLLQLSLDGKPVPKEPIAEFSINPLVETFENDKRKKPSLESYISGKMMDEYCEQIKSNMAISRYFQPRALVVYHFQLWVRRLFNAFVRLYNLSNKTRKPVKLFKSYFSIVWLVQDPTVQFTMEDLCNILQQQNLIEQQKLALKKDKRMSDKRLEEIYDEQKILQECNYLYWNRFAKIHQDTEMEDVDSEVLDTKMYVDTDSYAGTPTGESPMGFEANYGSYYGTEAKC